MATNHRIKSGDYPNDAELLELYINTPPADRAQLFASTSRTARIVGLSQRTIQFWIETGIIRAVRVGQIYYVDLAFLKHYLAQPKL
jgi:excisionase family DNA binding protein